jgi:hypothetical protein
MSSLHRLLPTVKNGQKIIDLTKMASITLEDKELPVVYNNVKKPIVGSFIIFTGGDSRAETYTYNTNEDAKKSFDEIMNTLEKINRQ